MVIFSTCKPIATRLLILIIATLTLCEGVTATPVQAQSTADNQQNYATINDSNISYGILPSVEKVNRDAIAIVIGNKNYQSRGKGVPDVKYAHNDADVITAFLVRSLGFREGNIINLKDASQNEMYAFFGNATYAKGKLYNLMRDGNSDLFVFYSGHGAPSLDNGQGYLLPVDADPEVIELTGYSLETFYKNIEKIPARTKTVMIDACFSGDSSGGSIVKNASSISLKLTAITPAKSDITLLTAAGLSEVASWDHDTKTGLFTRHFIEGVSGKADKNGYGNGDGAVSLKELAQYLDGEVAYSARSRYQRKQHPEVRGESDIFLAMWNTKLVEDRAEAELKRKQAKARKEKERIAAQKQQQLEKERLSAEAKKIRREKQEERENLAALKTKELKELEYKLRQQQLELEREKNRKKERLQESRALEEIYIPPSF